VDVPWRNTRRDDRIRSEEHHRAVFEFDFRAAVVGRNYISLANRKIQGRGLPAGVGVRQGIIAKAGGEAHVALHQAQANNTGMAVVCKGAGRNTQSKNGKRAKKKKKSAGHGKPLSNARVYTVRR